MTNIASIRGITLAASLTAGARATARSAAMASKIKDLPICDALQRTTATSAIQASVVKGIATLRIHFVLVEIAVRHVSIAPVWKATSADVVDKGVRAEDGRLLL